MTDSKWTPEPWTISLRPLSTTGRTPLCIFEVRSKEDGIAPSVSLQMPRDIAEWIEARVSACKSLDDPEADIRRLCEFVDQECQSAEISTDYGRLSRELKEAWTIARRWLAAHGKGNPS